ncbi:hypothetical protein [Morganella morganii]|uniref:hypothetical protein n=1 Tax=Morganella morganii TaxID=582 RepID=UPI00339C8473
MNSVTNQPVKIPFRELIKDTSEKFGNGGLRRFISEIKNSPEQLFGNTPERAELLGTRNFVALKNMFAADIGNITPFKNISDEIKVYRESQSAFCRFFKGRVLDKIQEQCTKIIEIKNDLDQKNKEEASLLLQKIRANSADYTLINIARPDVLTPVQMKTSGSVDLPASEQIDDKKAD